MLKTPCLNLAGGVHNGGRVRAGITVTMNKQIKTKHTHAAAQATTQPPPPLTTMGGQAGRRPNARLTAGQCDCLHASGPGGSAGAGAGWTAYDCVHRDDEQTNRLEERKRQRCCCCFLLPLLWQDERTESGPGT